MRHAALGTGCHGRLQQCHTVGDWTLVITDNLAGDEGTLNEWCLSIFGDGGGQPDINFIRGDFNNDGTVNFLVDALFGLNAGFVPGSPQPECFVAADADSNLSVSFLVDSLYMLNADFVMGAPLPQPPYPGCGTDANGIGALGCLNPNLVCNP